MPNNTEAKELLPCPIKEVYERFNHLDKLFSDPEWLGIDGEDNDGQAIRAALYEMWKSIKEFNTRKEPSKLTIEHDLSVHGQYIEKDGKRVDPKDFYIKAPLVSLKEHFEANMLDGQDLYDCGKAMLSAESVYEYLVSVINQAKEG